MFVINKKIGILKIQKVFYVFVMLLLSKMSGAQNGMNFQGVARNTSGIILASQPIAVRLSILQGTANGTLLYQETKTVTTNAQGIFNIVIGDPTGATSTTGSFTNIAWQTPPHFIRLEMDPAAGTNFATLGTTQLQFVAYAQFANGVAAENIVGLVPVVRGGTGASTLQDLKQNLQLNNVNNTSDLNKPISTATQTALNAKMNTVDTASLSARINRKINTEDSASVYITPNQLNNAFQRLDTSHVYRAIASKESSSNKSTATDLGGTSPSDVLYPSQKAVKAYVAANSASGGIADGGITDIKLATGAVTDVKVTSISGSKITGNITGATWSGTVIDIAKGGTGSSTKNFVDLTTTQTIAGNKTFIGTTNFTTDVTINSVTIGLGNNANIDNLVVGKDALITNTTGYSNLALGMNSLKSNTTGDGNIALGFGALFNNITGTSNIAIGRGALSSSTSGSRNIAIGDGLNMYGLTTGNENTSLGNGTLVNVSSGSHNTALGASANITDGTISNTTVIGYNALASTSNTIQLGNTEITSVITSGVVSATGFRGPLTGNASSATTAITAGNISATSNTTLTSLSNLNTVGTITSGTWSGNVIDIIKGGTGATNAAGARANLGLVIGTDIMAANATTALTGDLTGTGTGTFTTTLANTGVTAGTYGSSSTVPVLTIDAKGRVTNITTNAVSGGGGGSSDAATLTGNTLAPNITSSSLTGVGTITSGVWSGTTIAVAKGGTGATTAQAARNNLGIGTPTIAGQNNDQQQVLLGDVTTGELLYKDLYDINPTLFDDKASLTASQNNFTGDIKAKTYVLTNPSSTTASTTSTNINLATGNVLELLLTSNTTLAFSNPRIGTYIIKIKQDATGGRVVTFPTMKWADDSVPIITTTANRTDLLTIIYDGINYYATCLQNF